MNDDSKCELSILLGFPWKIGNWPSDVENFLVVTARALMIVTLVCKYRVGFLFSSEVVAMASL